jgi:hypothetical protein
MNVLRGKGDFRRVFGMPLLIAAISAIGLVSALLGDGVWNLVSWLALGLPLAVIAWHLLRTAPDR